MEKKTTNSEIKSVRFRKIAQKRTNKLINDLRLLGNTANKNSYSYTDDQIDKIFSAVDTKLLEVKGQFRRSKNDRFEL